MTNGAQAAGPAAAAAAIQSMDGMNGNSTMSSTYGSMSTGSVDAPPPIGEDDMIREDGEGDESEVEQVAKNLGIMKVDNNRQTFASEAHWYAILGEIAEVKNYFKEHKDQYNEQLRKVKASQGDQERVGTALLFGGAPPASREEILDCFPGKSTADMLITRYFNTYDPALHVVHGPTFQRQYDRHWAAPHETPIIWIGMTFSMMCIALQSYHRAGDEPPEFRGRCYDMSTEYRKLTAQSLILADITQPITHMLETLVLHLQSEYTRSKDAEAGVLVSVSIIVRLAMRMGYHRDPAPYPGMTPFQGEMRRRVWTVVRQSDLLFSSQAGLPPICRSSDSNCELPRNLYDDELFEEMKELPPSRPLTEATPISYMIAKGRLIYAFGKILEDSNCVQTCTSYDEVMNLDLQLRETQHSIPPHLKMRTMEESARDPTTLIMQRFNLDLLYLRSQCMLHRRFLGPSRTHSRYAYSRRTCIEASMQMLQHQETLQSECMPGGRLRNVKSFISSLTMHDFLMAAMTVCLDLYHTAEGERTGKEEADGYLWSHDRRESMMQAIEVAERIWAGMKDESIEAYKAHSTLNVMINKLKTHQAMHNGSVRGMSALAASNAASGFPGAPNPNMFANGSDDANLPPEQSAAMTLGMLSTGGLSPNTANVLSQDPNSKGFSYPTGMGNLLNDVPTTSGTGLTPNYNGPIDNGPTNAPSPFSNLFGVSNMGGFQGMDLPGNELNWVSDPLPTPSQDDPDCTPRPQNPTLVSIPLCQGFMDDMASADLSSFFTSFPAFCLCTGNGSQGACRMHGTRTSKGRAE